MSSIAKLYWNEQDGTVADVNDIKPIADKIDESIDVLNPLDDEVADARGTYTDLKSRLDNVDATNFNLDNRLRDVETEVINARGSYSNLSERITQNENDINSLFGAVESQVNYKGIWINGATANLGELWQYNNKFWVSLENNNTDEPSVLSSKWGLWDNISEYVYTPAIVNSSDINEDSTGTHTITNYDSEATYYIQANDSLITNISMSNGTITIETGDITDQQDHQVSYNVMVAKTGYLLATTTVTFNVIYVPVVADDGLLWEADTYTEDYFDIVSGGSIV